MIFRVIIVTTVLIKLLNPKVKQTLKLRKIGNSIDVSFPKDFLETFTLGE